ncbi:radical SAM protein [Ectothiorhodospiraceae bacterium WFHF3C12]|nr:radical SAM protein [Ectothiorhodospiraceae bacterium WFHF3C12]
MDDNLSKVIQPHPKTITIITTYQCNAACADCCFECGPHLRGRLSSKEITQFIQEARDTFPDLEVVVFSGGEPLLLGQDLFESIQAAKQLALTSRVVTNGYWGKTKRSALKTAERLKESGLSEINISTGRDHLNYISKEAVLGSVIALAHQEVPNLVTVESDDEQNSILTELLADPDIRRIQESNPSLLRFQVNSWMPFHDDSQRRQIPPKQSVDVPCQQLFNNLVLTPYRQISACCGLTFEHIDELKMGRLGEAPLEDYYKAQLEDFLKIWIKTDGPVRIIEKLSGFELPAPENGIHHICQACAILHKDANIRELAAEKYHEFVPEVISRFLARTSIDS